MFSNFQNPSKYSPSFGFDTVLFENDFKSIFPELFLVLAILVLLIYGVVYSTSKQKKYPLLVGNIGWLGVFSLFLTIVLLLKNPLNHGLVFYNTLVLDDLSRFFKIIALGGSIFSILISLDY
jgi:NADH:ubiquinone oxidoreductase subunit 2 (subunit N)